MDQIDVVEVLQEQARSRQMEMRRGPWEVITVFVDGMGPVRLMAVPGSKAVAIIQEDAFNQPIQTLMLLAAGGLWDGQVTKDGEESIQEQHRQLVSKIRDPLAPLITVAGSPSGGQVRVADISLDRGTDHPEVVPAPKDGFAEETPAREAGQSSFMRPGYLPDAAGGPDRPPPDEPQPALAPAGKVAADISLGIPKGSWLSSSSPLAAECATDVERLRQSLAEAEEKLRQWTANLALLRKLRNEASDFPYPHRHHLTDAISIMTHGRLRP